MNDQNLSKELHRVEQQSIGRRRANADRVKYDGTVAGKVHGSLLHLQIDFQEQRNNESEDKLCDWLDCLVKNFPDDFRDR